MEGNKIIIYQTEDGQTQIDVRLENDTVWLTQKQIAELFGTKRPAITKHLKNIYDSEELDENSTCSILEHMGNEGKQAYATKYYNLDAILSVGYRVNSKNATRFRQWANKVLKNFLVKGYAVNERIRKEQIGELRQLVGIFGRAIQNKEIEPNEENQALFDIVVDYTYMLLYLVTKNHSFSDGNKRIAATLFLWFLNNNRILYREDGSKRIADNTLVALTLMIAESRTEEKDVMVKVVVNLINQQNN